MTFLFFSPMVCFTRPFAFDKKWRSPYAPCSCSHPQHPTSTLRLDRHFSCPFCTLRLLYAPTFLFSSASLNCLFDEKWRSSYTHCSCSHTQNLNGDASSLLLLFLHLEILVLMECLSCFFIFRRRMEVFVYTKLLLSAAPTTMWVKKHPCCV